MKSLISVICALFILGCSNESTPVETSAPEAAIVPSTESTTPAQAPSTTVEQPIPSEATKAAVKAPEASNIDAGSIYTQKCASCHGAKAEKAALNKSQIIAGFSETQIKDALKGYQAGTYGKEMKALMQGQAKALDDAQIDALAKYIAEL